MIADRQKERALPLARRIKMLESNADKISHMIFKLEDQIHMLDSVEATTNALKVIKSAQEVNEKVMSDPVDTEELFDWVADVEQQEQKIHEHFTATTSEEEEDLIKELENMCLEDDPNQYEPREREVPPLATMKPIPREIDSDLEEWEEEK